MTDTRIPYGARCTWWDGIDRVGTREGIPCCPHCKNVLFEVQSEEDWWKGVDRYEASGHPGYRKMIEWGRGKCFPDYETMKSRYAAEGLN